MRIYTRTGDTGDTSLRWGERIPKDALRVDVYGQVDETNSVLGLALALLPPAPPVADGAPPSGLERVRQALLRIQRELFDVGADLATPPDRAQGQEPRLRPETIAALEQDIDALDAALPPLRQFILPGGAPAASTLQVARSVCRRAERQLVALQRQETLDPTLLRYLNRLSDFLFVAARAVNDSLGIQEPKVDFK